METEEVRLISLQELFGGKFMGFNLSTEAARAEDMDEAKALHGEPQCFCLDVYATATMEVVNADNSTKLSMKLEGLEIVDLQPTGLENSLECYLISVLRIGILPRIRIAVDAVIFDVNEKISLRATLPQPGQTSLTHNPAVEQDQVKVFINVGV